MIKYMRYHVTSCSIHLCNPTVLEWNAKLFKFRTSAQNWNYLTHVQLYHWDSLTIYIYIISTCHNISMITRDVVRWCTYQSCWRDRVNDIKMCWGAAASPRPPQPKIATVSPTWRRPCCITLACNEETTISSLVLSSINWWCKPS